MKEIGALLVSALLLGGARPGLPDRTAEFLLPAWQPILDPAVVDRSVMKALLDFIPTGKRLASPGESFEATDLVSGLPSRRFLLAGTAQSRWFVAYEHGGRGHHIHLVVFDTVSSTPAVRFAASGRAGVHDDLVGWHVSLSELKAAVSSRELREIVSDEF